MLQIKSASEILDLSDDFTFTDHFYIEKAKAETSLDHVIHFEGDDSDVAFSNHVFKLYQHLSSAENPLEGAWTFFWSGFETGGVYFLTEREQDSIKIKLLFGDL